MSQKQIDYAAGVFCNGLGLAVIAAGLVLLVKDGIIGVSALMAGASLMSWGLIHHARTRFHQYDN